MAETLLEKAKRLGIKPTGAAGGVQSVNTQAPTEQVPAQGETLLQKAQRLGIKPAAQQTNPTPVTPTIAGVKETGKQKLDHLKMEADAAKEKSDKLNSGFEQYIRPVADAVLPGVSDLGNTISGVINTNLQGPELEQQLQQLDNLQVSILRQIKDKHAKGKDATDLEQEYNSTSKLIDNLRAKFKESTAGADKTTGQATGELLSTGLNALTAGTYSRAKAATEVPTLVNTAQQALKTATPTLSKETGKQALKAALHAAPVAYGYDVASGLQGDRGADRTGANALIPGLGTAIPVAVSASIPVLSAAENAIKTNFTNFKAKQNLIGKITGNNKKQEDLIPSGDIPSQDKATTDVPAASIQISNKERNILSSTEKNLAAVEIKYAKFRKLQDLEKDGGKGSRFRIMVSDVLDGAVDENGIIRTRQQGGPVSQYRELSIGGTEGFMRNELQAEGKIVDGNTIFNILSDGIKNKGGITGKKLVAALNDVASEIKGYLISSGQDPNTPMDQVQIPLYILHDAKVSAYEAAYKQLDPSQKKYDKAIGDTLGAFIEKTSSVRVNEYNKEIAKYLQDIKRLEMLDGTRVMGGMLGKNIAMISNMIFGRLGPIASKITEKAASEIESAKMQSVFKNSSNAPAFEKSDIIKKAAERNAQLKLEKGV